LSESVEHKLEAFSALQIFPTLVWASQMKADVADRINAVFTDKIDQARATRADLQPQGKWQTDQRLHTMPELAEFCEVVTGIARHVLDTDRIRYRDIRITGCWANIGFPGSQHSAHAHPNNYLSGVYYVAAPPGGNTITFIDPRPQAGVMVPPGDQMSPRTAQKVTLDVRPGSLLLFPAWLFHSVDQNRADEERMSVAFNLMFRPYSEDMSTPLWRGNLQVTPDD
jgi:uncharacterized protein (TIGR02466 family)